MITLEQIRAARAMLGISQKQLAKKAGVAIATLNNIERGVQTDPKISTIRAIQGALEKDGIEFLSQSRGAIGVFFRPKTVQLKNATILIVDDNKSDRALYKNWLSKAPGRQYRIVEAENAHAGIEAFVQNEPQCVILDFMMYGEDGFQMLATLKSEHKKLPPILFVTGMHSDIVEGRAKAQGVHAYLQKNSLTKEALYEAVESALR